MPGSIPAPSDVAAPASDATVTASGLATKVLQPATGTQYPRANSRVRVHYTGWTTDGRMFESSVARLRQYRLDVRQVCASNGVEVTNLEVEAQEAQLVAGL